MKNAGRTLFMCIWFVSCVVSMPLMNGGWEKALCLIFAVISLFLAIASTHSEE